MVDLFLTSFTFGFSSLTEVAEIDLDFSGFRLGLVLGGSFSVWEVALVPLSSLSSSDSSSFSSSVGVKLTSESELST